MLAGGAQASHVFWQVNGAGALGANSTFAGTMIALDAVAIGNGSIVNGRAFALNGALTLDANEFYSAPPRRHDQRRRDRVHDRHDARRSAARPTSRRRRS